MKKKYKMVIAILIALLIMLLFGFAKIAHSKSEIRKDLEAQKVEKENLLKEIEKKSKEVDELNIKVKKLSEIKKSEKLAFVTGYNSVPEQTDSTPCHVATGENVCGRDDIVACPSGYAFGTKVEIMGKVYVCKDRTHSKFNGRFDIFCDKDFECPSRVTGYKKVVRL